MRKYLFLGLLGYLLIGLFPPIADAQTMQNDSYNLEKQSIDIEPYRQPTPKPFQKPESKPAYSGKNFSAYTDLSSSISFAISDDKLNFGKLTATNPVIRPLELQVISPTNYQILNIQNHSLLSGKNIIHDTTCDSGSCTEITSSTWTSTLTYGFGYHSSSMNENEYKQFPDISKKEHFEAVTPGKIIYKVNIAGTQEPGTYTNIITYLATPSF